MREEENRDQTLADGKAARIGIAQDFTVTHNQINVIVFFRRQLFAQDAQSGAGTAK
jgi:hypothetical protein